MTHRLPLLLFGLITAPLFHAQVTSPATKITASVRQTNNFFGCSADIDGEFAVSGAVLNDDYGTDAGIAYLYQRDANGSWNQIQVLVPADVQPEDRFGAHVAISGNYIVIGAGGQDVPDAGGTELQNTGAAYVFERTPGGIWEEVAKLVAPDRQAGDWIEYVHIQGTIAALGSFNGYDADGNNYIENAGAVYLFERTDGGQWLPVQKLVAPDRERNDFFMDVAIDGDFIAVGTPGADRNASGGDSLQSSGAVYVFERDASDIWNLAQKLTPTIRHAGAFFGEGVSLSGNRILVGAPNEGFDENESFFIPGSGACYVFERNDGGEWLQLQKLDLPDRAHPDDEFGDHVSLHDNYAVISSKSNIDENGQSFMNDAGAAYVFQYNGSSWSCIKKLIAPQRSAEDLFGQSVAISGSQILVGAPQEDEDANEQNTLSKAGSMYLFTLLDYVGLEMPELSAIQTWPNPTDGELTIAGDVAFDAITLTLRDMTGKVLDQTTVGFPGMLTYDIDQPAGVYFLGISAGKQSVVRKIVVQ